MPALLQVPLAWPCRSQLHITALPCAVIALVSLHYLITLQSFLSFFAYELDFARSSYFSLSCQSLSAVSRLHIELLWDVLGFAHGKGSSLHEGVLPCVAQAVHLGLGFFPQTVLLRWSYHWGWEALQSSLPLSLVHDCICELPVPTALR